jgi:hypothetical protein
LKTKDELLQMFREKQKQLTEGANPQKALMLNIEIILLREIIGDDLPEECNK